VKLKMKYAMIVLDVDGTLLNDDHELTETTKRSLRAVNESGLHIVLCTGRGPSNAIPILEQLGMEGVLITHNGAATVQTPERIVLNEYSFTITELKPLVYYCREHDVHFDANTAFDMYLEKMGPIETSMYDKFMLKPLNIPDLLALEKPVVKFTMFGEPAQMDTVEAHLGEDCLPSELHFIRSGTHFIDVMSTEASKGKALELLSRSWGIPRESILAMGNYYNDIEMIQFAGMGIAMDNSPDAVKAAADTVTLSNQEDGVHAALVKLGLIAGP
jgi:Cof subfamily protein (haloacid dehalogenase superfamily)